MARSLLQVSALKEIFPGAGEMDEQLTLTAPAEDLIICTTRLTTLRNSSSGDLTLPPVSKHADKTPTNKTKTRRPGLGGLVRVPGQPVRHKETLSQTNIKKTTPDYDIPRAILLYSLHIYHSLI